MTVSKPSYKLNSRPPNGDLYQNEEKQTHADSEESQVGINGPVNENARDASVNSNDRPVNGTLHDDDCELSGYSSWEQSECSEHQKGASKEHVALRDHIKSAEDASDLLGIASYSNVISGLLQRIKLDTLRNCLIEEIDQMDDEIARVVHYNALSINHVIPEDVMRQILSFGDLNGLNQNKIVCKQWNRLNEQNEMRMLRKMYQDVDDRNLEPLGPDGQIWVIHPTRPELHPVEIKRGYRGPLRCPLQIPQDSPVRALLHQGHYRMNNAVKRIQYVGLQSTHSEECQIDLEHCQRDFGIEQEAHFDKLTVNFTNEKSLIIRGDGAFKFTHCALQMHEMRSKLVVARGAYLAMEDCTLSAAHVCWLVKDIVEEIGLDQVYYQTWR